MARKTRFVITDDDTDVESESSDEEHETVSDTSGNSKEYNSDHDELTEVLEEPSTNASAEASRNERPQCSAKLDAMAKIKAMQISNVDTAVDDLVNKKLANLFCLFADHLHDDHVVHIFLTGTGYALSSRTQHLYIKEGLKYTAQSKWLATFTLYEQPYRDQLLRLEELIGSLNQIVKHYETELKTNNDNGADFFFIHGQQIQSCKKQLLYLRQRLDATNLLLKDKRSKSKRSLLPFLGHFLSGLTGTATEEDIKLLNDRITKVETNEKQFRHIMQDSLTIVNATRAKLSSFATL